MRDDNEFKNYRENRMPELITKITGKRNSQIIRDMVKKNLMLSSYLYCKECGTLYEGPSMLVSILSEEGIKALCDICKSNGIILDISEPMIEEINKIGTMQRLAETSRKRQWRITGDQLSSIIFDELL